MTARDTKGRFLKGHVANPIGRPKKELSLTTILRQAGGKRTKIGKTKPSQRMLLAALIWQAAVKGEVKFAGGRTLKIANLKDWHTIVAWLYDRVDGRPKEHIVTSEPEAEITAEDLTVAMAELEKWKKDRGG